MSVKSGEGGTCRLFLYVTQKIFLKHPAQNIRLYVASIIVHLMPHCARLRGQKKVTSPFDFDGDDYADDDSWREDIDALFDSGQHLEVCSNCSHWC